MYEEIGNLIIKHTTHDTYKIHFHQNKNVMICRRKKNHYVNMKKYYGKSLMIAIFRVQIEL